MESPASTPQTNTTRETREVETVRIGIVGGGFMARVHSLAYRAAALLLADSLPRIEQVRIADIDDQLARRAAEKYGWRDATADWREVTRADDIDLVDIVTPNDSHAEIAIDAAAHNKHIVCEKPLSNTLEGARRMEKAASRTEVLTQVGFVFRTWPATALAKQLIDEGRIGEIHTVRAHYFHDYALDPQFSLGWRAEQAVAGAGSIGDLGSHVIDLARCLAGEITKVNAQTSAVIGQRPGPDGNMRAVDVDDAATAMLNFANGATGVIQTNWMAAGHKTDIGFEVAGEHGAVRFTWERNNELRFYSHLDPARESGFRTIHIGPAHPGAEGFWPVAGQGLGYGDAFTVLLARFLGSLAAGVPTAPSFHDGLRAAAVLDAALASQSSGRWTDVAP